MSSMKYIYVEDETHRIAKAKAAMKGMEMKEYIHQLVTEDKVEL